MTTGSGRLAAAFLAAALVSAAPAALAQPNLQPGEPHGLGLWGPGIPDELKQAVKDPYAPPAAPACVTLPQELAQLDGLLGPDMNQPKQKTFSPTKWVGDAVRHAIPYRGYIRFITGADRKEKRLNQAVMAGWARRGFLKGLAAKLDCPSPAQLTEAAAPPPPRATQTPTLVAQAPVDATAATIQVPVLIPTANGPEPRATLEVAPAAGPVAVDAAAAGTLASSRN